MPCVETDTSTRTLWSLAGTDDVRFDAENPGIYPAFVEQAEAVKRAGFRHYSARTIVHVLRHHSAIRDGSGAWKINDHISPYLGRRLMRERPEFAGFFETRRAREDLEPE